MGHFGPILPNFGPGHFFFENPASSLNEDERKLEVDPPIKKESNSERQKSGQSGQSEVSQRSVRGQSEVSQVSQVSQVCELNHFESKNK